ncbi:carboxylesterase family domain-containing protein [Phthorimaea operculella]|nr:carboxylesterase family domain-containing protein [Phthorimaea operculella]
MASIKVLVVLSFVALVAGQGANPVVRISHGLLQGSWKVSDNGRTFASFEGVPYARPPVGKYRFRLILAQWKQIKVILKSKTKWSISLGTTFDYDS